MRLVPLATALLTIYCSVIDASGTPLGAAPTQHVSRIVAAPSLSSSTSLSANDQTLFARAGWLKGLKRKLKQNMKLCVSCNAPRPSPPPTPPGAQSPPRRTLSRPISFDNFRLHERFRAQGVGGDERRLPAKVDVSPIGVSGCLHGPTCAHVYGLEPHPPAANPP
ncbi:hypothetical protein BCV69DRAFT_295802 [Microstroma glucosiphilum]|uniref:Uncharacterized protein n=1 Tax=Pseudomicrostroma glucosiphilum TaxID=1684307 RepID=A0A316UJS0_9BASI|nr:hypothetical protein BCV69DRAFT_295802 [Pseudomicrostroma glucosiphilum]PWN23465.1 hypothetical protein BCV69DRAFT_295802 [Pseudomicrostroma glucosiphilum]